MDDGGRYSIQPPIVSNSSAHVDHFNSADYRREREGAQPRQGAAELGFPGPAVDSDHSEAGVAGVTVQQRRGGGEW